MFDRRVDTERVVQVTDEVRDEVAAALHRSPNLVHDQITTARLMNGPLAATSRALKDGQITPAQARVIVEQVRRLPGAVLCAHVDPAKDTAGSGGRACSVHPGVRGAAGPSAAARAHAGAVPDPGARPAAGRRDRRGRGTPPSRAGPLHPRRVGVPGRGRHGDAGRSARRPHRPCHPRRRRLRRPGPGDRRRLRGHRRRAAGRGPGRPRARAGAGHGAGRRPRAADVAARGSASAAATLPAARRRCRRHEQPPGGTATLPDGTLDRMGVRAGDDRRPRCPGAASPPAGGPADRHRRRPRPDPLRGVRAVAAVDQRPRPHLPVPRLPAARHRLPGRPHRPVG